MIYLFQFHSDNGMIFRTSSYVNSTNLKELLNCHIKNCGKDTKTVILYGIEGQKDGTFQQSDQNITNCFSCAIDLIKKENQSVIEDKKIVVQGVSIESESNQGKLKLVKWSGDGCEI